MVRTLGMHCIKTVVLIAAFSLLVIGCGEANKPSQPPVKPAADTPKTPAEAVPAATTPQPAAKKLKIGVMPKLVGIDFFKAAEVGAKLAAQELGVEMTFDGPGTADVAIQAQMLETWIAQSYDAIAIAPNDKSAIAPVLEKARKRGIKIITWDADALEESRDFFISQCTPESVAKSLMDVMAQGAGPNAKYIIVTGSLTADNQNRWMAEMEKYRAATYPNMVNLSPDPKAPGEDQAAATQVTADSLKAYPDLNGIFAITSVALPGAAEAIRKAGVADKVFLTGLATPKMMKEYVTDGTVKRFVLWSAKDLGYLAVQAAVGTAKGDLKPGATTFKAGTLNELKVNGTLIILGEPIVFDKDNIDKYDF